MLEARRVYDGQSIGPVEARESRTPSRDRPAGAGRPDLVIVGAASRDLTDRDPRGWRLGGTATYASLAVARLGLRVGCVLGVDDLAAGADEIHLLTGAGVKLRRVLLRHGPVFENVETGGHRRQRWLSGSDPMPVDALPEAWRGAAGWILGPIAGELPDAWSAVGPIDARIGLGWQGLLRTFGPHGWVERRAPAESPLVERAGLLCASVDDLPPGFALEELRRLAGGAASAVVLTDGANGGIAFDGPGLIRYQALAAEAVADPTGAGDVFLAALMVAWLVTGRRATARSLHFAAAAGSLAVEGLGLAGVPSRAALAARLRAGRALD